ncbi:MAG: hypothetical protein ACI9K9_000698 [Neolewinella sp.]|jgi:hypothetical protein
MLNAKTLSLRRWRKAHRRKLWPVITGIPTRVTDWPELLLVLLYVVGQCSCETLGVLWREDYPTLDLRLRSVRYDTDKIHYKLAITVRNNGEVGVYAFCDVFGKVDVQLVGLVFFLFVCHFGSNLVMR